MKSFKNTRAAVTTCLTLAVAAGVAYGGTSLTVAHGQSPKFFLRSASQFSISGTVTDSATSQSPALLYPGVQRYFRYQVTNPFSIPITVTSMSIASVTPPNGCPVTNLDDSATSFTGSLLVGADATSSVAEPISLVGGTGNQDACENGTFSFTFAGTATYTDSTTTVLASGSNPSAVGGSVTLTATVTAADQSLDTTSPTGTVEFFSCATSACGAPTSLGSSTLGSGTATLSTSALASGTDYLEATYEGATGNFSTSTSNVISQAVNNATANPAVLPLSAKAGRAIPGDVVVVTRRVVLGGTLHFTATVSGRGSILPTGNVRWTLTTPAGVRGCALTSALASGVTRCSIVATKAGRYVASVVYAGDDNYLSAASGNSLATVVRAKPAGVVTNVLSTSAGERAIFRVRVSGRGVRPKGSVTWLVSGSAGEKSCSVSTRALVAGSATCTILLSKRGTYAVAAHYSGDANYRSITTRTDTLS